MIASVKRRCVSASAVRRSTSRARLTEEARAAAYRDEMCMASAALAVEHAPDQFICCRRAFIINTHARFDHGGAERSVGGLVSRARDAPDNLQRFKRDEQAPAQVGEKAQLAVAARERTLAPRR